MANPHYTYDLTQLDGVWDRAKVMNPQTILLVIGTELASELLDRAVAERLPSVR
jgi:hypothetical protein